MTKRDLLENDLFKSIPDDTEIVFGTNAELKRCVPMNALNLSFRSENGRAALVIDAIPYWYLNDVYHITINEL